MLPKMLGLKLLALLIFDEQYGKTIRNTITKDKWVGDLFLTTLIDAVYGYIDLFGVVPKRHATDLIEANGTLNPSQKEQIFRLIDSSELLHSEAHKSFVMKQLDDFNRQFIWTDVGHKIIPMASDPTKYAEIENLVRDALHSRSLTFDPGSNLRDAVQRRMMMTEKDDFDSRISTGIEGLDKYRVWPKKKEVFMLLSGFKFGKSWGLIHFGKRGLIENKKVVHLTLENSVEETEDRYIQALYGFQKYDDGANQQFTHRIDTQRGIIDIIPQVIAPSLEDIAAMAKINKHLNSIERTLYDNLRIKKYPMNTLTFPELESYLDGLEEYEFFKPDMIIIDYPDQMELKSLNNTQQEITNIYRNLHRMAEERNVAIVVVSQANRAGIKKDLYRIEMEHVGQDINKIGICDKVISMSKNDEEEQMGIARLYVLASRTTRKNFEVMISQNYSTGQFALPNSSVELDQYWQNQRKLAIAAFKNEDPVTGKPL